MNESYITITADTHAGAAIDSYREYLDPSWRADFDAWRGAYSGPAQGRVSQHRGTAEDPGLARPLGSTRSPRGRRMRSNR